MLNSIIASCCGVSDDYFISSIIATSAMGICGEIAKKNLGKNEGSGTFRHKLIDAFYFIDDEKINNCGRIEIV